MSPVFIYGLFALESQEAVARILVYNLAAREVDAGVIALVLAEIINSLFFAAAERNIL
jgi:hypothetical protein